MRFEALGQAISLVAIGALIAYPVRGFLGGSFPVALKIAWFGLCLVAALRPRWSPWVLIATVPLVPIVPYVWTFTPHAIVHVVVIALALPMLVRRLRPQTVAHDDLLLALLLFAAVGTVSAIVEWSSFTPFFHSSRDFWAELHQDLSTYALSRPGRGIDNALPAVTVVWDGVLAYLIVREGARSMAPARLFGWLGVVSLVVAALGVAQAFTGIGLQFTWRRFDPGILRVSGSYADPNALAAFLALMLPIALGLAGAARPIGRRLAWLGGSAGIGAVLVLTGGRAGVIAAALGIAIGLTIGLLQRLDRDDPWPVLRRHFRRACRTVGVVAVIGLIALTTVGTAYDVRHEDQDSYLDTALYTVNMRRPLDERLKGRLTIWRIAGRMVRDAPTFGVGIGQIYGTFGVYNRDVRAFGPDVRLSAHNTFLNTAAETGLVGLAAFLLVVLILMRAAFRSALNPSAASWLRAGIAAGVTALLLTMLTGDRIVLREDVVVLCTVAALVMAWTPQGLRTRWLSVRVVAALTLALAVTVPARVASKIGTIPMERMTFGLFERDIDDTGRAFQWTAARATFHVPGRALRLLMPLRTTAPGTQVVDVYLDGRLVDVIEIRDADGWRPIRYPLPPASDGRYYRIDLEVTPTWTGDERGALGVMLGRYSWEP